MGLSSRLSTGSYDSDQDSFFFSLSLSQTQMVCLNRCRAYLISLLSLSEYLHACLNWDWLIMCFCVCAHSCTCMCVYVYFSISTGWKHNRSLVPRQSTVVKTSEWVFVHGLHHVCAFWPQIKLNCHIWITETNTIILGDL